MSTTPGNGVPGGRQAAVDLRGRGWLLLLVGLTIMLPVAAPAVEASRAELTSKLELAANQIEQAEQLGAKKHLPTCYTAATTALAAARKAVAAEDSSGGRDRQSAVSAATAAAAELLGRARFVDEVRNYRNPWDEATGRFDRALEEVARAAGLEIAPGLTGTAAARALAEGLNSRLLRQRVRADSLRLACTRLQHEYAASQAVQESTLTAMSVEMEALRQQAWQSELRAGLAEAGRSEAESDLAKIEARRQAVKAVRAALPEDAADVLLTPAGELIVHLQGLNFKVGSAQLPAQQQGLLDSLVAALGDFPIGGLLVEGHTDNTGGREENLVLSRRRAETVAWYLVDKLHLAPEQVEIVGHGPDRPLASNATAAGRARNRRIDIVIRPGG